MSTLSPPARRDDVFDSIINDMASCNWIAGIYTAKKYIKAYQ